MQLPDLTKELLTILGLISEISCQIKILAEVLNNPSSEGHVKQTEYQVILNDIRWLSEAIQYSDLLDIANQSGNPKKIYESCEELLVYQQELFCDHIDAKVTLERHGVSDKIILFSDCLKKIQKKLLATGELEYYQ